MPRGVRIRWNLAATKKVIRGSCPLRVSSLCRVRSIPNIPDKVQITICCVIRNEWRSRARIVAPSSALGWITVEALAWIMVGVRVTRRDRIDATSSILKNNSWKYERILQNRTSKYYLVWVCLDYGVRFGGQERRSDQVWLSTTNAL